MPQPSYAYACARVSALEKGLLSKQAIRRMAEGSFEDALRMLQDAKYGGGGDVAGEDVERLIEGAQRQAAQLLREISPNPRLTDLFLLQTDAQNLKVLVKSRLLGETETRWQEGGLFSRDALTAMVADQQYDALPKELCAALNALEESLNIERNPQRVSVWIDRGYLAHCLEEAKSCGEPFALEYFRALCDFDNVITFFRMRAMGAAREDLKDVLLPETGVSARALTDAYELSSETLLKVISVSVAKEALQKGLTAMLEGGNVSALEKARDDYLLSLVNEKRHEVTTIFPVVGYYLAREREAKAVRLILTVKRNGLDDGVIAERLRELYG